MSTKRQLQHTPLLPFTSNAQKLPRQANDNSAATFTNIIDAFWQSRIQTAIGAAVGLLCAIVILLITIPASKTTLLLAPSKPLGDNTFLPTSPQNIAIIKAIASTTGAGNADMFEQFIATYASQEAAKALLTEPQIRAGLTNDRSHYFAPKQKDWTPAKLSAYIKRRVTIHRHGITSMKTLQYWHNDPQFAQFFLTKLHAAADTLIRKNHNQQAKQRVEYLQNRLRSTPNIEHKQILNQLLLEQERSLMLSAIDQPFAANIVQTAQSHYKAQWPPKTLLTATLTLIGALIGYLTYRIKTTSTILHPKQPYGLSDQKQDAFDHHESQIEAFEYNEHKEAPSPKDT